MGFETRVGQIGHTYPVHMSIGVDPAEAGGQRPLGSNAGGGDICLVPTVCFDPYVKSEMHAQQGVSFFHRM